MNVVTARKKLNSRLSGRTYKANHISLSFVRSLTETEIDALKNTGTYFMKILSQNGHKYIGGARNYIKL